MSLKKFLAPNLTIFFALSLFWLGGVDNVIKDRNSDRKNLQKYIQTQQKIFDNYVGEVNITRLFKNSVKGLVANLKDSTLKLEGTPADTTFDNIHIDDLRESYKKFEEAYLYISNNSPDENMTRRTEDAIRGMFDILDPHSIYIEPEDSEAIDEEFAGKFQGIGVQFNVIQDTITVVTAISGGPSDQLGIMSGDRIIAINDSSSIGFTNEQVRNSLRGPKGSEVNVTIKRPHVEELLEFTIIRDDIPLYTVDTNYMLDEKTGYIKINRFAATTHEEFMEAMNAMEEEGMERIILDLRNNPGGYLSQAIAMAEEFFPSGTELVSTKSRHARFTSTYHSRKDGAFEDTPVIVLVNEGSASASEIVSGAIQDHDRGLIVGRRTFGKGLVQQQYGLVDSSKIRVTISKYYTPSGRLIQKPYSKGAENYAFEIYQRKDDSIGDAMEFINDVPDSLTYYTDAGRTVYGGGGVVPDEFVQPDTSQNAIVVNFMRRNRVGFDFVRDFLDHNGDSFRARWEDNFQKFREEFEWDQKEVDRVFAMLQEKGVVPVDTVSSPEFNEDKLLIPNGHFEEIEWMPRGIMKAELARQVWGLKNYYPVINDVFNNALKKSMELWEKVHTLEASASKQQERNDTG